MINISKELYDDTNRITIWDSEAKGWIALDRKLEQLKFTAEQITFLDDMFHKLVNR